MPPIGFWTASVGVPPGGAWFADLNDPRIIAALTKRCQQCHAVPSQHCRPYNRDRIVHEQRVPRPGATSECTHCQGDGYTVTDCACDWPQCRHCDGTGQMR